MTDATFHVVCHDCPVEHVTDDCSEARERWLTHRQATDDSHDVEYDAVAGAVDCADCGRETPIEAVKHLVNALTDERSFVCRDCWAAGGLW